MDEYLSDREQAERIKKWWKENYRAILAGFAVAALIISGWQYWKHRVQTRSATASAMYKNLSDALSGDNGPDALKIGDDLIAQYSDTPYAAQAALALAKYDVASNKPDDSMKMLNWVVAHSKDQGLVLLAKLRLARVQLNVGDPEAALKTLDTKDAGGFTALYDEVRGDAYVALGDQDKARTAYSEALAKWNDQMGDKSLIQMKLNKVSATAGDKPASGAKTK